MTAPVTTKAGRVLTLATIRNKGACGDARMAFRVKWGKQAVVDQRWAREAVSALPFNDDVQWAADNLLPPEWADIYAAIDEEYSFWTVDGLAARWAAFAALYVEAGKP